MSDNDQHSPFVSDDEAISEYAKICAQQVSGIRGAIPNEMDLDIAKKIFLFVETCIFETV